MGQHLGPGLPPIEAFGQRRGGCDARSAGENEGRPKLLVHKGAAKACVSRRRPGLHAALAGQELLRQAHPLGHQPRSGTGSLEGLARGRRRVLRR
jgi:hypothetical protein